MRDHTHPILAVGPNPTWQRTLFVRRLALGQVNRAERLETGAGGKATNLARALSSLGVGIEVAQFAGGDTGTMVCNDLEQMGVTHLTVRTGSTTRTCTTLLAQEPRGMTEVIDPSATITADECDQMRRLLAQRLPRATGVAICGTVPPGVPPNLCAEAVRQAAQHAVVVLDAYRDVEPTLRAGVHLLKINARELVELTGEKQTRAAARVCMGRFPVRALVVTDGPHDAFLFVRKRAWAFRLPEVPVVSPLGAGDCVTGVLLHRLTADRRLTPEAISEAPGAVVEAVRVALAHGSASCRNSSPGRVDPGTAAELVPRITARELA